MRLLVLALVLVLQSGLGLFACGAVCRLLSLARAQG